MALGKLHFIVCIWPKHQHRKIWIKVTAELLVNFSGSIQQIFPLIYIWMEMPEWLEPQLPQLEKCWQILIWRCKGNLSNQFAIKGFSKSITSLLTDDHPPSPTPLSMIENIGVNALFWKCHISVYINCWHISSFKCNYSHSMRQGEPLSYFGCLFRTFCCNIKE